MYNKILTSLLFSIIIVALIFEKNQKHNSKNSFFKRVFREHFCFFHVLSYMIRKLFYFILFLKNKEQSNTKPENPVLYNT